MYPKNIFGHLYCQNKMYLLYNVQNLFHSENILNYMYYNIENIKLKSNFYIKENQKFYYYYYNNYTYL